MPKQNFFKKVHALVAIIPPGKVMTYGQIAQVLGAVYSARFVGFAMHAAPKHLPCHRVVNQLGKMAEGPMFGGKEAQRELLQKEGVPFLPNGCINLELAKFLPEKQIINSL